MLVAKQLCRDVGGHGSWHWSCSSQPHPSDHFPWQPWPSLLADRRAVGLDMATRHMDGLKELVPCQPQRCLPLPLPTLQGAELPGTSLHGALLDPVLQCLQSGAELKGALQWSCPLETPARLLVQPQKIATEHRGQQSQQEGLQCPSALPACPREVAVSIGKQSNCSVRQQLSSAPGSPPGAPLCLQSPGR